MPTPPQIVAKLKTDVDATLAHFNLEFFNLKKKANVLLQPGVSPSKVDEFAKIVEKLRVDLGAGITSVGGVGAAAAVPLDKIEKGIAELKKDRREFGANVS